MTAPLAWSLRHPDLLIGWVTAEGVVEAESDPELTAELRARVSDPEQQGLDEETKKAVRDLLRGRGYKPSGRGKPASEYLAGAVARGRFPEIDNVVDINNLISLETGWPVSIFDLDSARAGGDGLEIRYGRPGESFAFNEAGQSIDIEGLISVARVGGEAIGNPVKDSMTAKISPDTRSVLAVLYTSRRVASVRSVGTAAHRLGTLLARHAGAETRESGVLPENPDDG